MGALSPLVDAYSLSNIPLPDDLVPEWSRYLDDLSVIITVVDEKVAALESVVAIMKQHRAKLNNRKTQVTSFRSPIRYLPAEILGRILLYALELDVLPLNHAGRLQFLAFRSVCSLWRTTAFGTLNLWRALDVDVTHWDQSGSIAFTAAMTSWFSRAGPEAELRLAVSSSSSGLSPSVDIRHITSLIDTTALPISTLEIKEGIFHTEEDLKVLVTASSARPTVKFLMVLLPSQERLGYGLNNFGLLHETYPSLERLALTGTDRHATYRHTTLTWLSLEIPAILPAMYLHSALPALEELVLSMETRSYDCDAVVLSSLKRLTVKNRSNECILLPLICPSLEFLHLLDIYSDVAAGELKVFSDVSERLLEGSKADRVTLRITNDLDATILRHSVIAKPNLNIHRLEMQDINLLLRAEGFKTKRGLPGTLEEIVVSQPPRIEDYQKGQELSQPGPSSRNARQSIEHWTPTRIADVYIPDCREEVERLNADEERRDEGGTLGFRFLSVTQDMVSLMLRETGGWIPYKEKAAYTGIKGR
ncbi:hypothetical protein BKA70DRAFT_757857 [Coprinopsis sp. MPI-PUGE-AT-0042]|nr:hypothetical protein BKA70DRAFT_757857 [Coprinopsis sp. MPI-PUGE-AT-0042]